METLTMIIGLAIALGIAVWFWRTFATNKKFRSLIWAVAIILVALYKFAN